MPNVKLLQTSTAAVPSPWDTAMVEKKRVEHHGKSSSYWTDLIPAPLVLPALNTGGAVVTPKLLIDKPGHPIAPGKDLKGGRNKLGRGFTAKV